MKSDDLIEERRRQIILMNSGLGTNGQEMTFEKYQVNKENKKAFELVKNWKLGGERSVYFYGRVGSGKTHLVCSILNKYILEKGAIAKLVKDSDIDGMEFVDIRELSHYLILVLDDLGTMTKEWHLVKLLQIVDQRYDDKLPTFATSNYSISELGKLFGGCGNQFLAEKIVSRLHGLCVEVLVGGSDGRKN